ncbi:MAG TPA: hypothetical protein VLE97_01755 [Gaiellaceae bacterium]|nr:hypothetical protein [Gaiellaceae bacterium]
MNDVKAYPLAWPAGWKRTTPHQRKTAAFKTGRRSYDSAGGAYVSAERVSIATGARRAHDELGRLGARSIIISSNLVLNLDGSPRSRQSAPADPGVAVYWTDRQKERRCMAIDRYDRVADNLAAIAATVEAMRAIERHGGAAILDRTFSGFVALPGPDTAPPWWVTFGLEPEANDGAVRATYRILRSTNHPDNGGDPAKFDAIQKAWNAYLDGILQEKRT